MNKLLPLLLAFSLVQIACGDDGGGGRRIVDPTPMGSAQPTPDVTPMMTPAMSPDPTPDSTPQPACSAANCGGCCDGNDICQPGVSDAVCGAGGAACASCPDGESCLGATCTPDVADCATGCLDDQDDCVAGDAPTACGSGGADCVACADGETCNAGKCEAVCNFSNCSGCCGEDGCVENTDDTACGALGTACVACAQDETCAGGECVTPTDSCDADTCPGCCDGTQCVLGAANSACGSGGAACVACGEGEFCFEGECDAPITECGPENCAGCCTAEGQCVEAGAQADSICGSGGDACRACQGATSCQQGSCVGDQPCLSFCETGCCTESGQCLELGEQDGDACGQTGLCGTCGDSEFCLQGACEANPGWTVWVVSAVVSATDEDGNDWDGSFFTDAEPDPYANVFFAGVPIGFDVFGNSLHLTENTATIDNTLTPFWNEAIADVTSMGLVDQILDIQIRDSDGLFGVPWEVMGACELTVTQEMLDAGEHTIANCGGQVTDLKLLFVSQQTTTQ